MDKMDVGYRTRYNGTDVVVYKKTAPNTAASLAAEMATKWGPVLAVPDGEDSAGRQQMRALTPAESANLICDIAAALVFEFERRGWLLGLPEPKAEK